ncbi:hypothetical protein FDECE_9617 [Fusarium decemcellulare]|nr:hypothetical protein FDECE_9617 [Fusarium decemcellulare]
MKAEWHRGSISVGLLATLLSFTTLSLQFTSTILLSQVGLASLPVAISVPQTYYGTDPDGLTFGSQTDVVPSFDYTTPVRFPAFAEWVSNATISDGTAQHGEFAPNSAPGIRDTGTVVRAFLPINDDDERSRLTEYHGLGTAVDTRVVCMRPKLTDIRYTTMTGYRVIGLVDNEQKPLGLLKQADEKGSNNFSMSFDCEFGAAAGPWDSELYGWPVALWEIIPSSSSDQVTLQITLCMLTFEAQEMEINATRPIPVPPEPILLWNTSTADYNLKAILRQLGSGPSSVSTAERSIFDLAPRSWQWPERSKDLVFTGGDFSITAALQGMSNTSTRDPALTLQAFFTILCAICYYDRIIMFDTAAPSLQVSLIQVTRLLGWTAFIIVVILVVLHLLLVLLVGLIFRQAGNLSRIKNAWAAISQLLGPTTEDWIRDADMVDDKTVESWLKARGLNKTLVRVEAVQGRVQLVKKDKVLPLPDTLADDFTHLLPTSQLLGNPSWPGDDQTQVLYPATDSARSSEPASSQVSSIGAPSIPHWMLAAAPEIPPVATTVGPPVSPAAHPTPAAQTTFSCASSGTPLYSQTAKQQNPTESSATANRPMSDELLLKRQRNRVAARRYRQKTMDRISELELQLELSRNECESLRYQLARQEAETAALKTLLQGSQRGW